MYDMKIHEDEFRLRILTTNKCNQECNHCLNDFQSKHGSRFINPHFVNKYIHEYASFMYNIGKESIVTFSGGEPGLHKDLTYMLKTASKVCDIVKVDTNTKAYTDVNRQYVDKWHIHGNERKGPSYNPNDNIVIQLIIDDYNITQKDFIDNIHNFIDYYRDYKIKLFVDFFSDYSKCYEFISTLDYPNIETRYTGNQINRGKACEGCKLDCITLKALWLFPNNTSSTCPQGIKKCYDKEEKAYDVIKISYKNHMKIKYPPRCESCGMIMKEITNDSPDKDYLGILTFHCPECQIQKYQIKE